MEKLLLLSCKKCGHLRNNGRLRSGSFICEECNNGAVYFTNYGTVVGGKGNCRTCGYHLGIQTLIYI